MKIDDYCSGKGISSRTAYRMIEREEIRAVKMSGLVYVVENNRTINIDAKKLITEKKELLDSYILSAQKSISSQPAIAKDIRDRLIAKITEEISSLSKLGITISGYNAKSIYRKLKQQSLSRQTRSDKFTVKHPILSRPEVRSKIHSAALCVYMKCARDNFSLLADLVLQQARNDENLYEVAAIPRSTLYNYFRNDFTQSGYKTLHKYVNHYNLFKKSLAKVSGAFTDDAEFFDYIIGDDHKLDVASVLTWNESAHKWEKKQVKIWLWIEAKTMMPLGWQIKVGDFKVSDLKESLSRVFYQYGLPRKAVVVDNGIGRGQEFRTFLFRAGLGVDQLRFSEAYDPTNKAPGERVFGFIKNEFDVFHNNFVGPNKEVESRHFGDALSPEETLETFESYKAKLESFLTGFFIGRPRRRRINGTMQSVTISDYFTQCYQTYNKVEVDHTKLRFAFAKEKDIKYNGDVTILGEKYQTIEPMPLGWYGRRFRILYNPADMTEVDMYTIDDMVSDDGKMYQKGTLVQTLFCVRLHPQKYELISDLKKKVLKNAKKLAADVASLGIANMNETEKFMPYLVANNGDLKDQMKQTKKHVLASLQYAVDKIKIEPASVGPVEPLNPAHVLQSDVSPAGTGDYSLTLEPEDDE